MTFDSSTWIYLKRPKVEAYVGHRVTPEWFWDVVWEPEVTRDEHKYSLKRVKSKMVKAKY